MCSISTQIPNDKNHEVCYHGNRFFLKKKKKAINFTTKFQSFCFSPWRSSPLQTRGKAQKSGNERIMPTVFISAFPPLSSLQVTISPPFYGKVLGQQSQPSLWRPGKHRWKDPESFSLVKIHVFAHMERERCQHASSPCVSSRQDPRQGSEMTASCEFQVPALLLF